MKITLERS